MGVILLRHLASFVPFILITGCHTYGGVSIHDSSFDSAYEEDRYIAHIGIAQKTSEHTEIFLEHNSMPRIVEGETATPGYGTNEIGIRGILQLW